MPPSRGTLAGDDKDKKVSVAIRIRPRLEHKGERYETGIVTKADSEKVSCVNPRQATREQHQFAFDHVFDEHDSQEEVYEIAAAELAVSALDGCAEGRRVGNVILTYGQTGSGKTYTLLGKGLGPSDELVPQSGIFLRVMHDLLRFKHRCEEQHLVIRLAIIEVYNEQLRDLLNDRQTLNYSERGEDIVPRNPQSWTINTIGEVRRAFALAHANRAVASTNMNDESSRSHALFIVDLFQQVKSKDTPIEHLEEMVRTGQWDLTTAKAQALAGKAGRSGIRSSRYSTGAGTPRSGADAKNSARMRSNSLTLARSQSVPPSVDFLEDSGLSAEELLAMGEARQQYPVTVSNLTMVDLAGSERTKRSHAAGSVFKEAVAVNTSLSVLGKVVNDIVYKSSHIPFRESMLTRLLRSSFMSERSKILLIANVAPTETSFHETRDTLKFADRLQMLRPPEGAAVSTFRAGDTEREAEFRACLRSAEELCAELRVVAEMHGYQLRTATSRCGSWPPVAKRAQDSLRQELTQRYRAWVATRDEADRQRVAEEQERLLREQVESRRAEQEAGNPQMALNREREVDLHRHLSEQTDLGSRLREELDSQKAKIDGERNEAAEPHRLFEQLSAQRRQLSDRLVAVVTQERGQQSEMESLRGEMGKVEPELEQCRRSSRSLDEQLETGLLLQRTLAQRLRDEARKRLEMAQCRLRNSELSLRVARLAAEQRRADELAASLESTPTPRQRADVGVSPLALHFNPQLQPPVYQPVVGDSTVSEAESPAPVATRVTKEPLPTRASIEQHHKKLREELARVAGRVKAAGELDDALAYEALEFLVQTKVSAKDLRDVAEKAQPSLGISVERLRADMAQQEQAYLIRGLALFPHSGRLLQWLSPHSPMPRIADYLEELFKLVQTPQQP